VATFTETFLCTAVPVGINGTKVQFAVLVSPRCGSDSPAAAALDNWPDVRDWPSIAPTWKVRIAQGGTTADLDAIEVPHTAYDQASWSAMFTPSSTVKPYQPEDRSDHPIFSYPVAKVRDTVKALHVNAMAGRRTTFPTVRDLANSPEFQQLMKAADPHRLAKTMAKQRDSVAADADIKVSDAFARLDGFFGDRPFSHSAFPAVTSLDPDHGYRNTATLIEIHGVNFVDGATVTFGDLGASADVDFVSSTLLRATSPNTGTTGHNVHVTVTTPIGTSAETADDIYRYTAMPGDPK
jgi:hypothetical protein